ncbi:serine/threonine-protein kinase [Kitasatospora sp. HPMI-4]|uniref:serine/threonine-protein kinase n=1 Tax=Kitasatospora sp. HPMI-4 TaxID=3448443 RepID=UPI003F1B5FB0
MSADRSPFTLLPVFQELTADDPREVGGYRLYARLGAGGMGRVYLSYTPGGRPVALKVVRPELAEDPEFRARFAQEVASARRIHGLFTAQVVDAGVETATPWLATTYVPGPSLHQVVQRFGPLPERTVLLLIAGIAEALQAIHATGVVHRDLKPGNVLIAADGPRVIDFGIARAADASALTGAGLRIGSPAYMAPEQAMGRAATPATDVHALGALAVHVAGGIPPFGNGPDPAALYRTVHEEPDLSRVPEGLHELLLRCLAKQPEHRPTTAEVIAAARNHPAVGGHLRFGEDWLPHPLTSQLTRHADLPQEPAEAPTALVPRPGGDTAETVLAPYPDATLASTYAPTLTALSPGPGLPAPPASSFAAPSGSATSAAPRPGTADGAGRRRTLGRTALTAAVALAIGAAGMALVLDDPAAVDAAPADASDSPSPGAPTAPPAPGGAPASTAPTSTAPSGTSPSASAPTGGYSAAYRAVELTAADSGYEFDLASGKVVPIDSATWFVGRTENGFLHPEGADTYLGRDAGLGVAECLEGLATRPAADLRFSAVGPRGAFCLRSPDGRNLAVVRVLSTADADGPVRVSVDHYHRNG